MQPRQIEMFAGVAASSMPTVKQFFSRQKFSLASWKSALKSSLTHLISNSARVKIPDHNPSFRGWDAGNMHTSTNRAGFRMRDLESGGGERKATRVPGEGGSQILLTQDISSIQEQLNGASLEPGVTGCEREL